MGRNTGKKQKVGYAGHEDGSTPRAETLLEKAWNETAHELSAPGVYTDAVRFLFKRNRERVSSYYCPNISCRCTFWDARQGYECPECGMLGIISEYRFRHLHWNPGERNIVGYVDSLGRLICSTCILNHGVQGEIGLVVYDDTEPFCFERCELCRETLDQFIP